MMKSGRFMAVVVVAAFVLGCSEGGSGERPDAAAEADAELADAAPSENATLAALTTTAGVLDPPFEPGVTEYDLDLLLVEGEVAFVPTAAEPASVTIRVGDAEVASGDASATMSLTPGSVDLDIVVVAAGGAAETYRIHVHRGVDALSTLAPSSGSLVPAFDAGVASYAVGVPLDTASLSWTPTLVTPGRADVTVDGEVVASGVASSATVLDVGEDPIAVVVTPHTRPARTYDVGVMRGIDALASISVSYAGDTLTNPLVPTFDPTTATYTLTVGLWLQRLQLTVTPLDAGATVTVNAGATAAGVPSVAIALNLGLTSIPIVVTAPGGAQRTYTLDVTRGNAVLQQAYAKASNTGAIDHYGASIALWGDTLVVGAYGEDSAATGIGGNQADNSAASSGAVYVFTRTGTTWSQQAYLKASNAAASDGFGFTVALWGDTLAVSAIYEASAATGIAGNQADNSAASSGAVYVFTRSGTTWAQQSYLKASNTGTDDQFGYGLALWGDTLAVGALQEDSAATGVDGNQADNTVINSGAVYVFTRAGGTWSQQAYLKASNTGGGGISDYFGMTVALSGDSLAVGAPGEPSAAAGIDGNQADNSALGAGAVYVFTRTGTTWSQQAYIKASNTGGGDSFGGAIAMSGATLAVGAVGEDSGYLGLGGGFIEQLDNSEGGSGAVYVFTRTGTVWLQRSYVKASNTLGGDQFGYAVALWGDALAVSAYLEDSAATGSGGDQLDVSASRSGAVYVFTRAETTWSQRTYLKASNTGADDRFGSALALWGDTVAVGADYESSAATGVDGNQADNSASNSGAVYVVR